MDINKYLIRLSYMIILIFGGVFVIRYLKDHELLLGEMLGLVVGILLLISSIIWKISNQETEKSY